MMSVAAAVGVKKGCKVGAGFDTANHLCHHFGVCSGMGLLLLTRQWFSSVNDGVRCDGWIREAV